MLRVSEIAAIDAADVSADADGSGRVTVRRSKTDQDGASHGVPIRINDHPGQPRLQFQLQ